MRCSRSPAVELPRLGFHAGRTILHLALISVAAIGVTGLYAAYLRVGSLHALYTSIYGQALLLKQAFVLALLLLAAINLLWILPRIRRAAADGARDVGIVGHFASAWSCSEIILGCLLLLSVSLLTYLPPAKVVAPSYELAGTTSADDLQVQHRAYRRARWVQNTFTVHLTSGGQPVTAVKEALLRFTPAKSGVAPSEAQLLSQGGGEYSAKGSYLSLPGRWQVQVVVRREGQFDAFANFNFVVLAPELSARPRQRTIWPASSSSLDGLLFALMMWGFAGGALLPLAASALLSVAMIAGGLSWRPARRGRQRAAQSHRARCSIRRCRTGHLRRALRSVPWTRRQRRRADRAEL